jgi:hypothetical protein
MLRPSVRISQPFSKKKSVGTAKLTACSGWLQAESKKLDRLDRWQMVAF